LEISLEIYQNEYTYDAWTDGRQKKNYSCYLAGERIGKKTVGRCYLCNLCNSRFSRFPSALIILRFASKVNVRVSHITKVFVLITRTELSNCDTTDRQTDRGHMKAFLNFTIGQTVTHLANVGTGVNILSTQHRKLHFRANTRNINT